METKFKAVLFDLDGTLVDSIADIADAMNDALGRLGYPRHDYPAYKLMVGNGLRNLAERCLPETARDPETIERCLAMMKDRYRDHSTEKTRPYDGIPELLDALTARGLKMAVLSNKADHLTQAICAGLLGGWHFETVLGQSDRFPLKPDPASALHVASVLGVQPAEILYLGDTGVDMHTATAAGMYPVGATWGFRTAAELAENGARTIIDHPGQMLSLL
ncbi:MAG: HAD family hydrolase [Rikenellaceae bacterium]|nr:HAD family hydrolase [Rikenellaceae bacterium]